MTRETEGKMPDFSQAELDRLCQAPSMRLQKALHTGAPTDVLHCFTRIIGLIRDIADLYCAWSVATVGWLHEQHGLAAAGDAIPVNELMPGDAITPLDARQISIVRSLLRGEDEQINRRVLQLAKAGEEAGLLALWDDVHDACDRAEVMRRDSLTAQLTLVNARYNSDGLEDCLRHAAEMVWVPRMERDLAFSPVERLRNWAEKMSVGHNGSVRVTEFSDRWVLTLDPCGSCGRQVLAGRYKAPWNFGVVADGVPVGFLRPDITVYQAHLAVVHGLVPIERNGAPWPAISCSGLSSTPCELVLYRNPAETDERYYAQVGARRSE